MKMKLLSTKEAAERLNVSPIRVRQFIQEGRLAAQLVGRDYIIQEAEIQRLEKSDRKPGRPAKVKDQADPKAV